MLRVRAAHKGKGEAEGGVLIKYGIHPGARFPEEGNEKREGVGMTRSGRR